MAKRPATAKALLKELDGHITASKATLTVNFGGATLPLYLPNAGIVTGEDYGAMKIGNATYLLELDRKGTNKSLKVVDTPDATKLAAIVKQLLPEPEEPTPSQEVLEALAVLGGSGFRVAYDAKGIASLAPVEDKPRRGRKPAGLSAMTSAPTKPLPDKIEVGATLKRRTGGKFMAGELYTVSAINGQEISFEGHSVPYKGFKEDGSRVPRFTIDWEGA